MRLTLVLPELIWPEPEDEAALGKLSCPGLEWLLARGELERRPALPYEEALAAIFGLAADAPFGALRLLGEPYPPPALLAGAGDGGRGARAGFWLCADPVHLRFHHERIILADAGAFELSEDEAHALVAGLNREFADLGEFHVANRRRWYVRLKAGSDFTAQPLSAVAGRRIAGDLPDEPEATPMRAWLNEIQMYLHGHPVNAARGNAGQPAVNSLWLWGAGALPEMADPDYDGVWSGEPLTLGFARACGIPTHALPGGLAPLLVHADPGSSQLVMLDHLLAPVLYEDARSWRAAMGELEGQWFAPLARALGRGIDALTLLAPTVYGQLAWQIAPAGRWKFWRRPRPLAALAKEFAQ